jgi:hypothetical protein
MVICELLWAVCKGKQETAVTLYTFLYCTWFPEVKFPIHVLVRFTDCFNLGPFDQDLSTAHSINVIRPVYFSFSLFALIIEKVQFRADPAQKFTILLTSTLLHNDWRSFPTLPYSVQCLKKNSLCNVGNKIHFPPNTTNTDVYQSK